MMATSASTGSEIVPLQELDRNIDTDATLGVDPWRPLHERCRSISVQKPKTDADLQQLAQLWNGRGDVSGGDDAIGQSPH